MKEGVAIIFRALESLKCSDSSHAYRHVSCKNRSQGDFDGVLRERHFSSHASIWYWYSNNNNDASSLV